MIDELDVVPPTLRQQLHADIKQFVRDLRLAWNKLHWTNEGFRPKEIRVPQHYYDEFPALFGDSLGADIAVREEVWEFHTIPVVVADVA